MACPHRGTSIVGVNHRRWNLSVVVKVEPVRVGMGTRNAVSERLFSAAMLCRVVSGRGKGGGASPVGVGMGVGGGERKQTAAGLPWNGFDAKASTW